MKILDTVASAHRWADAERRAGHRIGFVPTMGYLHEGHLSLARVARDRCDRCVVSIFVNPLQFGPTEDLDRYPRALERDRELLESVGVDALYLPGAQEMYPPGFQTEVRVNEVTRGLCGRSRPTHFAGVTTVVAKLFHAVKPHVAVFGEKDFQQLVTVRRMATDLDMDIEIVGVPTVREPDGLAMSSRNAYLSPDERRAAQVVPRAVAEAQRLVTAGERDPAAVLVAVSAVLAAEPLARLDYAELVDSTTLEPVRSIDDSTRFLLAVFVGATRLIDNAPLVVQSASTAARETSQTEER